MVLSKGKMYEPAWLPLLSFSHHSLWSMMTSAELDLIVQRDYGNHLLVAMAAHGRL